MPHINEAIREITQLVQGYLHSQFQGTFEFDPVNITQALDHDGDQCLNILVVFKGNQDLLDPTKTIIMADHVQSRLWEMDLPHYPVTHFVEKSEWVAEGHAVAATA